MIFVIIWLAAFRITRFVTSDVIFDGIRTKWFLKFPPTGPHKHKLGVLVSCAWCVSIWVAAVLVIVADQFVSIPLPWLMWLATSAVVGLLAKNLDD